jgi:hypothetical protein
VPESPSYFTFSSKIIKKKRTLGNVVDNGSHVDKAKTPPSVCGDVKARKKSTENN